MEVCGQNNPRQLIGLFLWLWRPAALNPGLPASISALPPQKILRLFFFSCMLVLPAVLCFLLLSGFFRIFLPAGGLLLTGSLCGMGWPDGGRLAPYGGWQ